MCFRFQEIAKRLDYSSVHYIEILKTKRAFNYPSYKNFGAYVHFLSALYHNGNFN